MSRRNEHTEVLRCDRCDAALVVPVGYQPEGWLLDEDTFDSLGNLRDADYCPACVARERGEGSNEG